MKARPFQVVGIFVLMLGLGFLLWIFLGEEEESAELEEQTTTEARSPSAVVKRSETLDAHPDMAEGAGDATTATADRDASLRFSVGLRFVTTRRVPLVGMDVELQHGETKSVLRTDDRGDLGFEMAAGSALTVRIPTHGFEESIQLRPEAPRRLIVITQRREVSVRVVDEAGMPLRDAEVWKGIPTREHVAATLVGRTDAEGLVLARGVDEDDYLQARHPDGRVSTADSWTNRDATGLTLIAAPALRRIQAIVKTPPRDAEGQDLPLLMICRPDAHGFDFGMSFEGLAIPMWKVEGAYLGLSPRARWHWRVDALVHGRVLQSKRVPRSAPSEVVVEFDFDRWKSLRIRVVDGDGQPIEGARILPKPYPFGPIMATDAQGSSELSVFPGTETLEMTVWHHRHGSVARTFDRSELENDLRIVLDRKVEFTGRVVTTSGVPLPKQLIYFHALDQPDVQGLSLEVDEEGRFYSWLPLEKEQTRFSLRDPRLIEPWATGERPEVVDGEPLVIRVPDPGEVTAALTIRHPSLASGQRRPQVMWTRPRDYGNRPWFVEPKSTELRMGGLVPGPMHLWYEVEAEDGTTLATEPRLVDLKAGEEQTCVLENPRPMAILHLVANREIELMVGGKPFAAYATPENAGQEIRIPSGTLEVVVYRAGSTAADVRTMTLKPGELIKIE